MRPPRSHHLKPLPPPLRWLLALLLVLNGSGVAPAMGHAAMASAAEGGSGHAMSTHCHTADAAVTPAGTKHLKTDCSCCFHGDTCQCARVVASVLPLAFPDLRPLTPQALSAHFHAPAPVAEAPRRLLRPPIPASPFAALAA